jgi:hypothetical protein
MHDSRYSLSFCLRKRRKGPPALARTRWNSGEAAEFQAFWKRMESTSSMTYFICGLAGSVGRV